MIALLALVGLLAQGVVDPYKFSVASYLIQQDFEGTGYDNSETWSESGTGTVDEDSTSTVLEGSQSLRITLSAQTGRAISPTFASQTDCWTYFKFRTTAIPASAHIIYELQEGALECLRVRLTSAGKLDIRAGGGTIGTTTDAVSVDITYEVRIRYTVGTGSDAFGSIEFITSGDFIGSGNAYTETTNGTSTRNPTNLKLGTSASSTADIIFDKVRVDESAIGSNPP